MYSRHDMRGTRGQFLVYILSRHISIEHNISDPPHLILISQTHFGQGRVLLNIWQYIQITSETCSTISHLLLVSVIATCPRGHKCFLDSKSFSSQCQQTDSFLWILSSGSECCSACLCFSGIPPAHIWGCHWIQSCSIAVDFGNWTSWVSPWGSPD